MKKTILLLLALLCTLSLMACEPIDDMFGDEPMDAKPVIYLYPTEETEVSVKLEYGGEFIATYPKYNDGWEVIASPDGTLTSLDGARANITVCFGRARADLNTISRAALS